MITIDRDRADQIAVDAKRIVGWQDAIKQAGELIDLLKDDSTGVIMVEFQLPLVQRGYTCPVSTASAIQLLRESIEITQQHVQAASDRLRSALKE